MGDRFDAGQAPTRDDEKIRWARKDRADTGAASCAPTKPKRLGAEFELGQGEGVVECDFAEVVVAAGSAAMASAHIDL
jgi:hypothetical protein